MAKDMADSGSCAWLGSLKAAISAYNNIGHCHLLGSEPSDVKDSKALIYEQRVQAGEDMKHDKELHDDKAYALKNAGAFRTMQPRNRWARAHQLCWGDKIHKVDRFVGPDVIDTEGNRIPVNLVLPVKAHRTRRGPEGIDGRKARADWGICEELCGLSPAYSNASL